MFLHIYSDETKHTPPPCPCPCLTLFLITVKNALHASLVVLSLSQLEAAISSFHVPSSLFFFPNVYLCAYLPNLFFTLPCFRLVVSVNNLKSVRETVCRVV